MLRAYVVLLFAGCAVETPIYCDEQFPCPGERICVEHLCRNPGDDLAVPVDLSCGSSESCSKEAPICAGVCRACESDEECGARDSATPRCALDGERKGQCVACSSTANKQSSDCAGAVPVCTAEQSCRKCAANGECDSGVCMPDGRCAAMAEVAYVDNDGKSDVDCQSDGKTHDGNSPATPFCTMTEAGASSKKISVVKGSAVAYSGTLDINDLFVVGPGTAATPRATLKEFIVAGAKAKFLTLEGIELTQGKGIVCDDVGMSPKIVLTLRDVWLHHTGGSGDYAALTSSFKCEVNFDRVTVGPVTQGVNITGPYVITNSLFTGNIIKYAVRLESAATGLFLFNTVFENQGGVQCGHASQELRYSIVRNNGANQTIDQTTALCTNTESLHGVLGEPTPQFVNKPNFDFRLADQTGSRDCCIDKVMVDPRLPNVDHDRDGMPRFKGLGWDYGAYESF